MTKDFEVAQPVTAAPKQPLRHEPLHEGTIPRQVPRGAGYWNLTTKHTVDLGDVDRRETHKFPIYYLGSGTNGPRIDARLKGDPAMRLLHAPMSLPASSQPYTENNHFKVDFNPQREGTFESELEIDVLETPHERHRVTVIGSANAPGRGDDKEPRKPTSAVKQTGKPDESRDERDRHYHSGAIEDLRQAENSLRMQLIALMAVRESGIKAAQDTVQNFKRVPPKRDTLLRELAMAAMSIATAGIGGLLSSRLLPVVTSMLTKVKATRLGDLHVAPPDHFVSFFSEAIEATVQTLGGAAIGKLEPAASTPRNSPVSRDAMIEFFRLERDSVAKDLPVRADATANRVSRELRPLCEGTPQMTTWPRGAREAVAGVWECARAISSETEKASEIQAHETVKHWVRYVAATDMAGRDPGGLRSVDTKFDGLVDLTLDAEQANATKPVAVRNVRLNGVRQSVVQHFMNIPLSQTGLAIRAACQFSPEQAVIVLKRPDGDLEYTDTPNEVGSWLAKKAGVRARPLEVDKERGARMLFAEVARKSIQEHLTGGLQGVYGYDASKFVENDSDEEQP